MLPCSIHGCITLPSIWKGHGHAFPGEYFQKAEGHEAALNQWEGAAYLMTNLNLKSMRTRQTQCKDILWGSPSSQDKHYTSQHQHHTKERFWCTLRSVLYVHSTPKCKHFYSGHQYSGILIFWYLLCVISWMEPRLVDSHHLRMVSSEHSIELCSPD